VSIRSDSHILLVGEPGKVESFLLYFFRIFHLFFRTREKPASPSSIQSCSQVETEKQGYIFLDSYANHVEIRLSSLISKKLVEWMK
jgi:hypothetical protein